MKLASIFTFLVTAAPMWAATFIVNSTADGPPINDEFLTLREAITAAQNSDDEVNTVEFDPALIADGPAIIDLTEFDQGLGGGDGTALTSEAGPTAFIIEHSLTITGPKVPNSQGIIIRRAEGSPNFRFFHVRQTVRLSLNRLTLTGGRARGGNGANGGGGGAGLGGAILMMGSVDIKDCTLSGNRAIGGNGGRSIDSNNGGGGGGLGADAMGSQGGGPNGSSVGDGDFGGGGGGSLGTGGNGGYGGGGGVISAELGELFAERAGRGGFGGGGGAAVSIRAGERGSEFGGGLGSSFQGVVGGGGGGLGAGGAIFLYPGARLEMHSSLLQNNSCRGGDGVAFPDTDTSGARGGEGGAAFGGAIFNDGADIVSSNCTFARNSLRTGAINEKFGGGGAIFTQGGSAIISHGTFSGNRVAQEFRGAIEGIDIEELILNNSILANTEGGRDLHFIRSVTFSNNTSGRGNLIESQSGFEGEIVSSDDPELEPLAENGGPTETFAIRMSSPAWNTGEDIVSTEIEFDGRGMRRAAFGRVDIGAYEAEASRIFYVRAGALGGDGSSWENAFSDLQPALLAAAPGEEIWVARGTYLPGGLREDSFVIPSGVGVLGGFLGSETDAGQRDPRPQVNGTVLSGEIGVDDRSFHVVTATGSNGFLSGFTITGGLANGDAANRDHLGGGILVDGSGVPVFSELLVSNNHAELAGGGIYVNAASAQISDVTFLSNTSATNGAGVYLNNSSSILDRIQVLQNTAGNAAGGMFLSGSPVVRDSLIAQNICTGTGAGIFVNSNTTARLTNLTVTRNSGAQGAVWISPAGGVAQIRNSILFNNIGSSGNLSDLGMLREAGLAGSSHNLVGSVSDNTEGTLGIISNASPRFVGEADYRLSGFSPVTRVGNINFVETRIDLVGRPRAGDTVSLGAYQGSHILYSSLNSNLDPNGDENGDGLSNYLNYAQGSDPRNPFNPLLQPTYVGDQFTYVHRTGVDDVFPEVEASSDLETWRPLVEGSDYQVLRISTRANLAITTLRLTLPEELPQSFVRLKISATEPF